MLFARPLPLLSATTIGLALVVCTPAPALAQDASPTPTPQATPTPAAQPEKKKSMLEKMKSSEDGWVDMSEFMASRYGFLPIFAPITEPAVGLGFAAGLAFMSGAIDSDRPNTTAAGGLVTENSTHGLFAGDNRYYRNQSFQTIVKAVYASVNLDFYGIGHDSVLADNPLRYNIQPTGASFEAKGRIAKSPVWIGASYAFANTTVEFEAPPNAPGLPPIARTTKVGGVSPSFTFDTRDNLFTPIHGTFVEARVDVFSTNLGGDDDFQRVRAVGMHFMKLPRRVFLGVKAEGAAVFGDGPFYLMPFVLMRGIPAVRYQGKELVQLELEARWQFWKRLSVVAFAGGGKTWAGTTEHDRSDVVGASGLGFRYELARKFGIHAGADFAYGPAGHAFYIQIGSAWARP